MSNAATQSAPARMIVVGVFAGAYKGGRLSLKATLTHVVTVSDDGPTVGHCRIPLDSLCCDYEEQGAPTCKTCLRVWNKAHAAV